MITDKNAYFKYHEHRAMSGYRASILVKEQNDPFYSLLVASETVPSIYGSQDSYEFDLLNSPTRGKVAGKVTLEDKEVEVLHHRDNVYRFEQLKDKVLDFMYVDGEFVGYKFSGTLSYRVNDATADILRGTYTITPMSADPTPIMDARSLCKENLCFADVIPESISAPTTGTTNVSVSVVQSDAVLACAITKYDNTTRTWSANTDLTFASGNVSITSTASGLYALTVSDSNDKYAPWTTTIYVG